MNSINAQQPENNHQDLASAPAVAKIKELVKQAPTCFLCTAITTGNPIPTRPMAVQKVGDDGSLFFLSASDSHQNMQIARDNAVQLLFAGSPHSDFMTLYGQAVVTSDKARIKELWTPLAKTWFTGGEDDPRITVIQVTPVSGYYWDTKHNRAIAFAKMVVGAVTGKTLDDSIEGRLNPGA